MTDNEIRKLLALMSLGDNRKAPRQDDVEGWRLVLDFWQGMIGDLTFADCSAAVGAHYRETDAWLRPSHIRERVNTTRRARWLEADPQSKIPPRELLGNEAAYREWLRVRQNAIANGLTDDQQRAMEAAPGALRAIGGGAR